MPLHPYARRWSCRCPGFSLVEMLVVLAIMGVLVTIVMASLRAAREARIMTECTANLRSLGIIMHSYVAEYGTYPKASVAGQGSWNGPRSGLLAYTGNVQGLQSLTVCPYNRDENAPITTGQDYNPGYPYLVNYNVIVNNEAEPVRANGIRDPEATVLLLDSAVGSRWGGGFFGPGGSVDARIGTPHPGQSVNLLWCDGHVSAAPRGEVMNKREWFIPGTYE